MQFQLLSKLRTRDMSRDRDRTHSNDVFTLFLRSSASENQRDTERECHEEGEGWRVKGLSVWQIVDSRSISTIALTVAPRQRQQELPFIMLGRVWRVYHAIWFWPYAFSVCTLPPFAHCLPLFLATVNPLALTYVFPSHPVFFSHSSLCSGKLLSKAEKHRNQK